MNQKIRKIIKKSSLFSSIYWKFLYCPAALQMDLSKLESVADVFNGNIMKELEIGSPMFDEYVNFINISYNEKTYSKNELKDFLLHHHYLKNVKTFVLLTNSNRIVGTISVGVYDNKDWGGIFKFAVNKSKRNQGIGLYLLRFGYESLRKRGCLYGESIVSDRNNRIPSLMTHFKCGFKPQTQRELVQFKVCRGRYNIIKSRFTNKWVMKYYDLYLSNHKQS